MSDQNPKPAPKGRVRHCWYCGADMGFIEDRYYNRLDTCGESECDREARNAWEDERREAHERVDRNFDGGW